MMPLKLLNNSCRRKTHAAESGNVLFIIMLAVVVLAALTAAISRQSETQVDVLDRQTMDNEISRMLSYTSVMGGALSQMLVNGENSDTLYLTLSLLRPGDVGYETSPHNTKIYHPMGGGVEYMSASATTATPAATDLRVNPAAIITGIGPTNVTVGDIIFTAVVSTATYCQRINTVVTGSSAVTLAPVLTTVNFDTLFTTSTAVTIGANCTPTCANIPRQCVSNTAGTAWGFYSAMLPG